MSAQPANASLIPLPAEVEWRSGHFALSPQTAIVAEGVDQWHAAYLRSMLRAATDFDLPIRAPEPGQRDAIRLQRSPSHAALGPEGYALTVSPDEIAIGAPGEAGVWYGIQTLRQLLPVEVEQPVPSSGVAWRVPCAAIVDRPRFRWRGYMLDEGRHFHGKETVLRTLDLMALLKLNVLHWHLTEDQGWRIEIDGYPRLTEVGSMRQGTARGFLGKPDSVPHGGFYRQREIREVVRYAAQRQIAIVPEVEMPGHSLAALAAYPELSCTGGPFEVSRRFGIRSDIYCAGKESVFAFLQDVLGEVMALFPSPYIHIGGDEAPKARWRRCPDCQERIRREGLGDVHGLQVYFVNRIAAYLDAHGRRAVGWNQILHDGLAPSAAFQYWVGSRRAVVEAARQGRDVVMSSMWHTYLDHSYSLTPLSAAYRYEPVLPGMSASEAQHVLGLEAPMWTEMVPDRARLDYQTFPRLLAYAETGWTPREAKALDSFWGRVAAFLPRLDALGVRYAPLDEVEPPWYKRVVGPLTILQRQTKTAPPREAEPRGDH
ncbi:MAG: beta-N-acetylhexosaminidase [Anaerolineae bacterium]|nr:beta-N-acetylhexosaminidase [Anaerolineae bacterium]